MAEKKDFIIVERSIRHGLLVSLYTRFIIKYMASNFNIPRDSLK